MKKLTFFVKDEPYGKQRPRLSRFGTYTPKNTLSKENYIKYVTQLQMIEQNIKIFEKEIYVELEFIFTRPKSVSEKKRPNHTVKPDIDNCIKLTLDAMNKIAYKDDSLIIAITAKKRYAKNEEEAKTNIKIIEVEL